MPLQPAGPAPYAPAGAILSVIDRYREVGFSGQPVTDLTLGKIGVSESLRPRTIASLRLLDLIQDDGTPTDQLDVLKNARPAEFDDRLAEWLRDTYAPIFGFCDPATATAKQIEEAFWGYEPAGQRTRMANLFSGLAARAGLIAVAPQKPRGRHANPTTNATSAGASTAKSTAKGGEPKVKEAPPEPGEATLAGYRKRYLDMLIERAEKIEQPDSDLLDRIERALGIAPAGGGSP